MENLFSSSSDNFTNDPVVSLSIDESLSVSGLEILTQWKQPIRTNNDQ